jgi:hypothetical protein
MITAWVLLSAPAFVPPKQYVHPSGKTVECATVRALPPGQVLTHLSTRLPADPDALFGALGTCLAQGPHLCDRAWVGWGAFGGLSMAVIDGVAPPIERRQAAFIQTCKALPVKDQPCALLSGDKTKCEPVRQRLRAALAKVR